MPLLCIPGVLLLLLLLLLHYKVLRLQARGRGTGRCACSYGYASSVTLARHQNSRTTERYWAIDRPSVLLTRPFACVL
jgi:hypothetical protein